jgi:hypothetical protein
MLKNSKVVLFLSPYKVGQAGNIWTLLRIFIRASLKFLEGSADFNVHILMYKAMCSFFNMKHFFFNLFPLYANITTISVSRLILY